MPDANNAGAATGAATGATSQNNDSNNANNDGGNGGAGSQGADANNADAGTDANANANNSGLTEAQLAEAFKHPRFKELTTAAQELKSLKDKQAKAEQDALKEQGKHQELAEAKSKEADEYKNKFESSVRNNAVIVEATKLGVHDANVVAKLIDGSKLTINEDGTVQGAAEAVADLQKSNPYLFKTGSTTKMGGDDTGGGNSQAHEFSASQFKDAAFYKENQAKMDKAMIENRVDMTK